VVHAVFYNFADGEVTRHIPRVWDTVTPEAALAAREQGSVAALRQILGDLADAPGLARAADLATKAATSAPTEGRILYAALRALPLPAEPVARLWHAATLLREHRGDGHIAALVAAGIGGTQAHVLHALSEHMPAAKFGRVHHLPADRLATVVDGMRARGLIDASGWLSDADQATKERIESLTDTLAAPAYSHRITLPLVSRGHVDEARVKQSVTAHRQVISVQLDTEEPPVEFTRGQGRRTGSQEGVEYEVAGLTGDLDTPAREFCRERGEVTGGGLVRPRPDIPDSPQAAVIRALHGFHVVLVALRFRKQKDLFVIASGTVPNTFRLRVGFAPDDLRTEIPASLLEGEGDAPWHTNEVFILQPLRCRWPQAHGTCAILLVRRPPTAIPRGIRVPYVQPQRAVRAQHAKYLVEKIRESADVGIHRLVQPNLAFDAIVTQGPVGRRGDRGLD
jgi:hypothetical protein